MRAFALMTLTAGLLGTMSAPASAAQIVETFTISASGAPDQNFLSTPFDLFHPSLGTLTSVGESVSGSLTWTPGASDQELLLVLGKTGTSQFFSGSESGEAQVINVSLTGAGGFQDPAFVGTGTTQENLAASQSPGVGTLSGDSLTGQVTYTYTPAAVPEPSTSAMMLLGFAVLGYAFDRLKPAARRKPACRSVPA
jgi:hypothetical protein